MPGGPKIPDPRYENRASWKILLFWPGDLQLTGPQKNLAWASLSVIRVIVKNDIQNVLLTVLSHILFSTLPSNPWSLLKVNPSNKAKSSLQLSFGQKKKKLTLKWCSSDVVFGQAAQSSNKVPDPVVTGKQRLFQFKKEVFDQNSSKGEIQWKHKEQPAQGHRRRRTGLWESTAQVGQHLHGKLIPLMVKGNMSRRLTHTCL